MRILISVFSVCLLFAEVRAQDVPVAAFREVQAFPAPEAHQGVAVDATHFYPITNRAVAKYDKQTGKLVKRWTRPTKSHSST